MNSLLIALFLIATSQRVVFGGTVCEDACDAAARTDGDTITNMINSGDDLCGCRCDDDGNTLLHVSVPAECIVCANSLVDLGGCKVDKRNYLGNTALHEAAFSCQSPMLNILLDLGAHPNKRTYKSKTPLCLAAVSGNENCGGIVNDLVANGAKICNTCFFSTPFDLCNNQVVCDVIEQNEGDECYYY